MRQPDLHKLLEVFADSAIGKGVIMSKTPMLWQVNDMTVADAANVNQQDINKSKARLFFDNATEALQIGREKAVLLVKSSFTTNTIVLTLGDAYTQFNSTADRLTNYTQPKRKTIALPVSVPVPRGKVLPFVRPGSAA